MNNSNNDVLSLELQKNDVGEETTLALRSTFMPFFEQANKLAIGAKAIVVTSKDQKDDMAMAREMRLAIKNIRTTVEKERKALKENVVRKGKAIDGLANIIKFLIVPVEEHLQKQEDFVKLREEKRKLELVEVRSAELRQFDMSEADIACHNLGEMSEEGYQVLRESWKMTFENKLKFEREVEEKRIATKKADTERRIEIELENDRLRAEAEESRKKQQEKLARERAKLKAEREVRQGLSAELKTREEAEKLQKREAREAFKRAELKPDKQKLETLAVIITEIELPTLTGETAQSILKKVCIELSRIHAFIKNECLNL